MRLSTILAFVFPFVLLALVPLHLLLAQGLVPQCEGFGCGFCSLGVLMQNVINWLVVFSATVATLMLVYAGVLYVTAAANPSQIERAKKVFWYVIVGFIFVLTAWLIIDAILKGLSGQGLNSFGPWNALNCNASGIDTEGNIITF